MKKASVTITIALFFLMVSPSLIFGSDCTSPVTGSLLYPDNDPTQLYLITGPKIGTTHITCTTNGQDGKVYAGSGGTRLVFYKFLSMREDGYCSEYDTDEYPAQKYYGPDPANCPPDCTDERADLAAQCGGDNKIMNWDDQTCTGECKPDCTEEYANLVTACGGRQYIDWFDDETCLGECVTCDDVQDYCESQGFDTSDPSVYQCTDEGFFETFPDGSGGGITVGQYWHTGIDADEQCGFDSGFDPDDPGPDDPPKDPPPEDPPADRPCAELKNDCIAACNGKVANFTCSEGGTYNCQCQGDQPPDDPTPNPGDPGETPPDTGDDSPEGESGSGDTDPDGTNDNALLGDIVDNTNITADNTKRIGDILQTELNKLNATGQSTYDRLGTSNQWLSQIEAALNAGNGFLADIKKELGKGLDVDVDVNTSGIESRLDTISGKLDATYNAEDLPDQNEYVSTIPPEDLPVEENFVETINDFLSNAPFVGSITSSSIDLNNIDPCLTGTFFGSSASICVDDYETQWNAMGYMLVAFFTLAAFFIIIGRG